MSRSIAVRLASLMQPLPAPAMRAADQTTMCLTRPLVRTAQQAAEDDPAADARAGEDAHHRAVAACCADGSYVRPGVTFDEHRIQQVLEGAGRATLTRLRLGELTTPAL